MVKIVMWHVRLPSGKVLKFLGREDVFPYSRLLRAAGMGDGTHPFRILHFLLLDCRFAYTRVLQRMSYVPPREPVSLLPQFSDSLYTVSATDPRDPGERRARTVPAESSAAAVYKFLTLEKELGAESLSPSETVALLRSATASVHPSRTDTPIPVFYMWT
jgi:hypothetical protein